VPGNRPVISRARGPRHSHRKDYATLCHSHMVMLPTGNMSRVSFGDIAFKGRFKYLLLAVIFMAVAFLVVSSVMASQAPPNYSGTTLTDEFGIDVKDTTEQPVRIVVSHTFHLVTGSGSSYFDLASGEAWLVEYNLTVRDAEGRIVLDKDSTFMAPLTHEFSGSATTGTEKSEDSYPVQLSPGKYEVSLLADHPVDYRVEQEYKALPAMQALLAAGVLSLIVAIGLVIYALKKRDAINRSRTVALLSGAQSPQNIFSAPYSIPPPPPPLYYPTAGAPPPASYPESGGGQQPQPADAARRSSLEYVPGGLYAEIICPNCGWSVHNRPIGGYVTCEHCGETGYIQ
jgi:hypothetical protein